MKPRKYTTDNYRGKNKVLSTHLETNDVNAG